MGEAHANPLLVGLFFVIRCLVPLLVMLGISYLLRKLGLVSEPPKPPPETQNNGRNNQVDSTEGDLAHGKA